MTGESDTPTVLVVDDEPAYLAAYERWLSGAYEVRAAASGEEALAEIDASVDVGFLDRRMPGQSGETVLAAIRERGYDCRVSMLTAVDPGLDIVDMPFDEYLVKPVTREELLETTETLLARAALDATVRECYALAAKKSVLESNLSRDTLEADERYRELCDRLAMVQERAERTVDDLVATGDIAGAYHDIES